MLYHYSMSFVKVDYPIKGDLLRVHRKEGYYHFGIAVSKDRVIHFTAEKSDLSQDKKDFLIIESSLERFLLGGELEIEAPYSSKFERDEVVNRAKNYVNSQLFHKKYYNFISNNCEHFARYCYDGSAQSEQVVTGTIAVVAAGALIAGAVIGKIASSHRKKIEQKK